MGFFFLSKQKTTFDGDGNSYRSSAAGSQSDAARSQWSEMLL
jgi:hypothetical protein